MKEGDRLEEERKPGETFFTVQDWMITELGLKGTALLIYGLLHGYTQAVGEFSGSLAYIGRRVNATVQQVHKLLKGMVEMGILEKEEVYQNGVKFVKYRTKADLTPMQENCIPCAKDDGGLQESCMGVYKRDEEGLQKSLQKSKDYIKNNNKDNTKVCAADTRPSGGNIPSLEEVCSFCREIQSTVEPSVFYHYYAASGWTANGRPIHDWRAKLRYWDQKDREKGKTTAPANMPGFTENEALYQAIFQECGG